MARILVLLFFCVSAATAQSDRGALSGRVMDPSGAGIPGAQIQATAAATGVKTATKSLDNGSYLLGGLPYGRYDVTVTATGFSKLSQSQMELSIGQTLSLDFTLQVGQMDQTVEVTSNPAPVDSSTSVTATVISPQQVLALPLAISGNMRNPESFILLTPGVTGDTGNTQINGSPSRAKEVVFDGATATGPESGGTLATYPSVEAIGEFKLVSSTFNAEYGRTGGGFEIFTTKSGANQLHGALYDYLRNNVFDARGFFSTATPVNRQNEFGVNVGGPVFIPKVYNGHNRTFFYFVYGGFRYRAGQTNSLVSVPPAPFKNGDFSQLVDKNGKPVIIYDPSSTRLVNGVTVRDAFPGNTIPATRFSSVSQKILPLLPTPSNSNLTNNFLTVGAQTFDRNQYDFKIDHNFTENNRLSVFTYINRENSIDPLLLPNPLSSALNQSRPALWIRLNHDLIFSPSTLNHFTASLTREPQIWHKLSADQNWPVQLGLKGVNTGYGNAFPLITFSNGFATLADQTKTDGEQVNNSFEYTDTVSHTMGDHSLKFGVDGRWLRTNGADFAGTQGTFGFNSNETALAGNAANTGNAFASFLLGLADTATNRTLLVVPGDRYRYAAFFAQDDWKITRKLTLNYGLRYEIYLPKSEAFNNISGFDPTVANPAAGGRLGAVAFLGSGTGRNGRSSFADTDYKNFGPRAGLAFSLDAKTVFRAGYGLYYALGNANGGLRASQNFSYGFNPSSSLASQDAGGTPGLTWDNGFPASSLISGINPSIQNGSTVNTVLKTDGRPPYSQNWSAGIQRELPGAILMEANYVGVKGTRLGNSLIDLNQLDPSYLRLGGLLTQSVTSLAAVAAGIAVPYAGFTGTVAQSLRPYPQFLSIPDQSNPNGNSTYHSLQTKLEKRLSKGVTFLAAYTFAKTISDSDILAGGGPAGQTYYNRKPEKSLSTNDVPQIFAANVVYELPFGAGKPMLSKGLAARVLGGWTVTGIAQYQVGRPIPLTLNNTLPLFNSTLRPNVVQGVPLQNHYDHFDPAVDRWIDTAAFQAPAPFTFGSAAREYSNLRAPALKNESVGLIKRTLLTERVALTFRAEFFNVFNRVVFAAPASNVSNANFGTITGQANTPRQGQVSLRLEF
jgi:hypothetical protein